MDIVHHTLIGGAGFIAGVGGGNELAGAAFLGGSVLPDLDVFFMIFGKRFYLRNHQGPTHSLILSPILAAMIAGPLLYLSEFNVTIVAAALFGLWAHIFLDWINTFGISLFWPLTPKRFSLNAVFFIDLPAWLITLGFYAHYFFRGNRGVAYAYGLIFSLYVFLRIMLYLYVRRKLDSTLIVPSSFNPFGFFVLQETGNGIETYYYNFITRIITDRDTYQAPSKKYVEMAEKSKVFRDISKIMKYFQITDVSEDHGGTTIVAHDLGIRNFGGKFGRTILKFDQDGALESETANI
ncbi:metal-dependent hydrolase [Thermodesulfobacteriota bacterium]